MYKITQLTKNVLTKNVLLVVIVATSSCQTRQKTNSTYEVPTSENYFLGLPFFSDDLYIGCYYYDPQNPYLGTTEIRPKWTWAKEGDDYLKLSGKFDEGFYVINDTKNDFFSITKACQKSIPTNMSLLEFKAFKSKASVDEYELLFLKDLSREQLFKKIIVFGDSISDNGNIHRWGTFLLNKPYWLGRFSNGRVWTDYFSTFLNHTPIMNWAYGGMRTRYQATENVTIKKYLEKNVENFLTGNIESITYNYLKKYSPSRPNIEENLYIFWIGANNYKSKAKFSGIKTTSETVAITVSDIIKAIEKISKAGANKFLLITLPITAITEMLEKRAVELFRAHNNLLRTKVAEMQEGKHKLNISIFSIDEHFSLLEEELKAINTTIDKPCYSGTSTTQGKLCENPDSFLMFDSSHPTSRSHCIIALQIYKHLSDNGLIVTEHDDKHLKLKELCYSEYQSLFFRKSL